MTTIDLDLAGKPSYYGVCSPDNTHVSPVYVVEGNYDNPRLGKHTPQEFAGTGFPFEELLKVEPSPIAKQSYGVGGLVIRFFKGTASRIERASAFIVARGVVVTARHALIPPVELEEGWMLHSIHFVDQPSLYSEDVRDTDNCDPYFKARPLGNVVIDKGQEIVVTSKGPKAWSTKYDAIFLEVEKMDFEPTKIFYPATPTTANNTGNKGEVGAIGYPVSPPTYILPFLFPRNFLLPNEAMLINNSDITDLQRHAVNNIFRLDRRSVTPGTIVGFTDWNHFTQDSMICFELSILGGFSGGPVVLLQDSRLFISIVAGAFNQENFNVGVSVNHPLFVADYIKYVVPKFKNEIPELVQKFIDFHS